MFWFLLGIYIGIAIPTFVISGIGVMLGGKEEELWIPFAAALFWPVFIPLILCRRI